MSNEEISYKLMSEFQMKVALFTAVSILLVGCVLFVFFKNNLTSFNTLMTFSVAIIGGVSAIRYTVIFRNKFLGGHISYGRSVLWNIRFYLLSGMVLALGSYLFLRFHPDFINSLFSQFESMMVEMQKMNQTLPISIEDMKQQKEIMLSSSNISIAIDLWITYCLFGVGASLVYSLFIKKV